MATPSARAPRSFPATIPTLLFTNAGMVQFKKVFLGHGGHARWTAARYDVAEVRARRRQAQRSRAGRPHLRGITRSSRCSGNFSFGDYFKRDAIRFAWEFVTEELKLPTRASARHGLPRGRRSARALAELTGVAESRIYGLGAKDNFWQMADTGPCGPCYGDLRRPREHGAGLGVPEDATGEWTRHRSRGVLDSTRSWKAPKRGASSRSGTSCSCSSTGRRTARSCRCRSRRSTRARGSSALRRCCRASRATYHTDLFLPLIEEGGGDRRHPLSRASRPRDSDGVRPRGAPRAIDPASFRVLADHARAVAFLLADGVFPSNEGRGYVLRRILRRAVRHAWLLGRRAPTLVHRRRGRHRRACATCIPSLQQRRQHIIDTTTRGGRAFPRDDRRRHGALRRARAGRIHAGLDAPARHDQRRRRVPPVRHVRVPDRPDRAHGARARLSRRHRGLRGGARRSSASSRRRSASRASSV